MHNKRRESKISADVLHPAMASKNIKELLCSASVLQLKSPKRCSKLKMCRKLAQYSSLQDDCSLPNPSSWRNARRRHR